MIELGPSTLTRNRHTVQNDEKTALIKRINRKLAPKFKKVRVNIRGEAYIVHTLYAYVICTGVDLTGLASSLGVTNATACANVLESLPTNSGKIYFNKAGKPCFSQEISR